MKTNLVDMVKVTPISKGVERHTFTPARDVNSREPNDGNQQSTNTFNQALEQQENTQKATVNFKQRDSGRNSDLPKEEQTVSKAEKKATSETVPADESVKVEHVENTEEVKDVVTELPEEDVVDLEGVSQTVVIQEIKPEQENTQKELTGNRESETESKINTLLSLLSNKTNLKVPKLEQYITTLREAGKSVGEILNTLKAVLEEVVDTKEGKLDLKDFVLKIVPVEEGDAPDEKPQVNKTDDIPVKQAVKVANNSNPETNVEESLASKPETEDTKTQKGSEQTLTENVTLVETTKVVTNDTTSSEVVIEKTVAQEESTKLQNTKGQEKPTINREELLTEAFKNQSQNEQPIEKPTDNTIEQSKSVDQLPEEANKALRRLADLFRSFDKGIVNEEIKINSEQKGQNDLLQTFLNAKTPSGERVIDVIAKTLDVKPEIIEEFFNSKLFPDEQKVDSIIQTVQFERIESFLKDNPILISQMLDTQLNDIINLEHDAMKATLQFKSVKVETVVIKEFIQKGFEFKAFSKDFFSTGENILLKHKERVFTVEKMAVRFIKKETAASNEKTERPIRDDSRNTAQKVTSSVKRFIQQSFKDGYESSSRRMMDLARIQTKASQPVPEKEAIQNTLTKSDKSVTEVISQEKKSDTRLFSFSQNEDKDTKQTQKPQETETAVHETYTKTYKGSSEPVVKGEQSFQARNIEQMYQKIKDMTQLMARQQTRTELATIKLNPPELGRVSLEVIKEGNKLSIVMQVETKEAQEILNKNSSALAARLVSSGFELQKVTVQMEKYEEQGENPSNQNGENNSQQEQNEDQDGNNDNEFLYEEEYTFTELLKGGIEKNAG